MVLPGAHRTGRGGAGEPAVQRHYQRRDWQLCDDDPLLRSGGATAVPMERGSLLLFDSFLPHGTAANAGGARRWALQLHYVGAAELDGLWRPVGGRGSPCASINHTLRS